jgi:hypothetical protein
MPDEARKSMRKELEQLVRKRVWTLLHFSKLNSAQKRALIRQSIRSSLFLKEKYFPNGLFEKLKSRLVAGGHMQDRSIYTEEDTSSPTVATQSAFMVAAIAATEKRHVATVDIGGAYLNADLPKDKPIFMKLDKLLAEMLEDIDPALKGKLHQYTDDKGDIYVQLDKALYGCIEAGKAWFDLLTAFLKSLGFTPNPYDTCVFNKDVNGQQITICLHVDDLLITSSNSEAIDDLVNALTSRFEECQVHRGAVHSYLGMTFDFQSRPGKVIITQGKYVFDLLFAHGISADDSIADTPATDKLFYVRNGAKPLGPAARDAFRSSVAKLLYLAKRTRPDILVAVTFLCTRVLCSDEHDIHKLTRVLRYLNGTRNLGLTLDADSLNVIGYIDAAYGVHDDGKSRTGVVITLGGGAVFAKSSTQELVTKSSCEAEIVGLSTGSTQVLWTRYFLLSQGYELGPATVHQDNQGAITMIQKGKSTSDRTRHIHIRFFFVHDRIQSGEIKLAYCPTGDMLADILTKPLARTPFVRLRNILLNCEVINDTA